MLIAGAGPGSGHFLEPSVRQAPATPPAGDRGAPAQEGQRRGYYLPSRSRSVRIHSDRACPALARAVRWASTPSARGIAEDDFDADYFEFYACGICARPRR